MADQTFSVGGDVSGLEAASNKAVALLEGQNVAIKNLMVTQYTWNKDQDKYNATVVATLDNGKKLVQSLEKEKNGWELVKASLRQTTNEYERLAAAAQKAKAADLKKYLGDLSTAADKYAPKAPQEPREEKGYITFASAARIAEATVLKAAVNALVQSFFEATQKAKDFQIEISLIRTVSQQAQLGFGQWSKGIKDVSDSLGFDLVDTAKAAYEAIQSQVAVGPQALQFLETAGQLARTTGTDLKHSADLLSSVILGFNLSVTEADHTAAVLFKTVELGRIKIDELTNTLGKVAPSANLLGINLEEVGAALATLTKQGIKTTDATTLVQNIILKLAKPTENLKNVFHEWGVESGDAAVKIFGFAGVLKKLTEATNGGRLPELAELFNEIRGLRGVTGLTGAFDDFQKNLKEIDDADKTYKNAQVIRTESAADKLAKFSTNVKNVFVEDFGQIGLSIVQGLIEPLGKGGDAARVFVTGAGVTVATLIGLKVATVAYTGVSGLFVAAELAKAQSLAAATAAQETLTAAVAKGATFEQANTAATAAGTVARNTATVSQAANRTAMINSIGTLGILTAAITAGTLIWQAYNAELGRASYSSDANIGRIVDDIEHLREATSTATSGDKLKFFSDLVRLSFKEPLLAAAETYKAAAANLKQLETQGKSLGESFGVSYKNYIDTFKEGVKELNKEITKANENIKVSKREALGFKDSLDDIIRKTQYKYANDQQKLDLTEQNIRRLQGEINSLYAKGDDDSIKSARHKFDEVAKLAEESFDQQQQLTIKSQEEYLKNNPSYGPSVIAVSTEPLQRRLNGILGQRNALEATYQDQQKNTVDSKKEQVKVEEDRIRKLEIASKKLIGFDVFDDQGKAKKTYTDDRGRFDPAKVKADLDKIVEEVKGLTPKPRPEDEEQYAAFYSKLYARVGNIVLTANAKINEQKATQDQQTIIKASEDLVSGYKKAQDSIAKLSASAYAKGGQFDLLQADAETLKNFTDAGPEGLNKLFNKGRTGPEQNRLQEAAKEQYNKTSAAIQKAKTNGDIVEGQLIPDPATVNAAAIEIEKLKEIVRNYIQLLNTEGANIDFQNTLLPGKGGKSLKYGDVGADIEKQYKGLLDAGKEVDKQLETIAKLKADVQQFQKDALFPLIREFPNLEKEATKAAAATKEGIDGIKTSLEKAIEATQRLREELKTLPAPGAPEGKKITAIDQEIAPIYASTGKYVHPGSPRGEDKIPAWLSPGEFVINAASTRKFYAQLVSMNQGKQPQYFNSGGYVTNNIGDINVTISGTESKSPARIGRQVAQEIRREIRRGTVREQ